MFQRIIIANDHGGYQMKLALVAVLRERGMTVEDIGCHSEEIVRYPYYAEQVARAVAGGDYDAGILICSTGIGMSMVANRFPGARASLVSDHYSAMMTRQHNDSNILCLGGKTLGIFQAIDCLHAWLDNDYIGERHDISLGLIGEIDAFGETRTKGL